MIPPPEPDRAAVVPVVRVRWRGVDYTPTRSLFDRMSAIDRARRQRERRDGWLKAAFVFVCGTIFGTVIALGIAHP